MPAATVARFHLPDFVQGMEIYHYLVFAFRYTPDCFFDNTAIESVFGCFDDCIWNGGTMYVGGSVSFMQMREIIDHYNHDLNIPLTFTFTNPTITTQAQCEDRYANLIAEYGNNGFNRIQVSSPVLEEYLRKHYKNYLYNRSIIASEKIPYDVKNYHISVIQRAKNNDWDYLNTIPEEDRGSIEFLCNDPCPDDCPRIYSHYWDLGRHQAALDDTKHHEIECIYKNDYWLRHNMLSFKTYISRQQIDEQYLPAGFQHFKLSGRNAPSRILAGVLSYMIKPDYREDVLTGAAQYQINVGAHYNRWFNNYTTLH